jgi:hypothetical protein
LPWLIWTCSHPWALRGAFKQAIEILDDNGLLHDAVLDINLGEYVFPAADMLADRSIPFFFATG